MKRVLLWIMTAAALGAPLAAFGVQAVESRRAEASLREGLELLSAPLAVAPTVERLDADRASRAFERVRTVGGDESRTRLATTLWHVSRGYADLARGEVVMAAQSSATALREMPENPHARLLAGMIALRRGDLSRAEQLLAGVDGDAAAPPVLRLRAGIHHLDVLIDGQRAHPALNLAETLAAAHPREGAVANRLGLARMALGDAAGARTAFDRALALAPGDPAPRINLAELARQRGELNEARAQLERALALREDDGEAWLAYGVVLGSLGPGQRTAARAAIQRAARILPDAAGPWVAQGDLDVQEGRWSDAVTSFRAALLRDAQHVAARTNLGVALARTGDTRGALAAFDEATQRAPNAGEAWNGLGAMRLAAGEIPAAVDALQRAMVLLVDDPNPAMNLGLAMERMERWDEAARAFREVLRRAPGHGQATEHLARLQPTRPPPRRPRAARG